MAVQIPAFIQNAFGIRTWDDVRNMIHSGAPALSTALVGWNVVDDQKATLIVGLVVAMASPLAAYPHADNNFRKYLYGVIAAFQAVLIGVIGVVDSPVLDLVGSALAILGGMVASTNTPVSRDTDFVYVPPAEVEKPPASTSVAGHEYWLQQRDDSQPVSQTVSRGTDMSAGWRGL